MKPWFGVHRFWGWYPKTIEGYVLIALMVVSLVVTVLIIDTNSHSISQTLLIGFPWVSSIVALTILITQLTGAQPAFNQEKAANFSPDNPKVYLIPPALFFGFCFYYLLIDNLAGSALLLTTALILSKLYLNLAGQNNVRR